MWLCRAEVGPGYDRFAWLAHIRQIHGSRSRIVEIPLRPLLPYWDDTRLLDVTRGGTSRGPHTSSSSSSTAFMPRAGDLDGLSTGDLSMVYPLHGRGNRAANRVILFLSLILRFPRRGANQT